jgi:hypothetical protein
MRYETFRKTRPGWLPIVGFIAAAAFRGPALAEPYRPGVEFDFARSVECRDVTPQERLALFPEERVIEVTLGISVRFHGVAAEDLDEFDVEITGAPAAIRVLAFAPTTTLASDVSEPIETTTTTRTATSLDATLGGALPVPYAELVAHVSPSINAGTSRSESATQTVSRLPPRRPVVVSGTSSAGQGVFFKFKRSSQTSLEGFHEVTVSFIVPGEWTEGTIRVGASARGRRKILWVKQPATLGRAAGEVKLRLVGDPVPCKSCAAWPSADR